MKIVLVGVLAALLTTVAAQARGHRDSGAQQQQNPEQQKQARAKEEKDYKSALSHIPNQKAADPWDKIR